MTRDVESNASQSEVVEDISVVNIAASYWSILAPSLVVSCYPVLSTDARNHVTVENAQSVPMLVSTSSPVAVAQQ